MQVLKPQTSTHLLHTPSPPLSHSNFTPTLNPPLHPSPAWGSISMTVGSKLIQANIASIWQETPTVKGLQLAVVRGHGFVVGQQRSHGSKHPHASRPQVAGGARTLGGSMLCSAVDLLMKHGELFRRCLS